MVVDVAFSADGKTLASTSHGKNITIWNAAGKELHKLIGHDKDVRAVVFTSDCKTKRAWCGP